MEAEGEAMTFVASEEENDLHGIEKVLGKAIPQVTLPDFDNEAPPPKVHRREGAHARRRMETSTRTKPAAVKTASAT